MNKNVVYHHLYGRGIIIPFIENVYTKPYDVIVYFPDSFDITLHNIYGTFPERKYRMFTNADTYCAKDCCSNTKCLIKHKQIGFYSLLQELIEEETLLASKTNCQQN